jgi:cytochrome P450
MQTIVSCQCYSTQRDPGIFPEPDEFRPERWLDGKGDLTAMRDMILVWGKGQRACMGRPIAIMELKIATASIMRDFSVQLGSSSTDIDMEMTDHFVLMAKGGKCILSFNNVDV